MRPPDAKAPYGPFVEIVSSYLSFRGDLSFEALSNSFPFISKKAFFKGIVLITAFLKAFLRLFKRLFFRL